MRKSPSDRSTTNGVPNLASQAADTDSRANLLYADEHAPLTFAEAWTLLVKSWPFIAHERRLLVIKSALAISSLVFFLMTPWSVKIVIDNVIDGHPLTGIPAALLMPFAGSDRASILVTVSVFLVVAVILIGMIGDSTAGLNTSVQSGGLDQAGLTANEANSGWSLWNGIFGYLESSVTIDLSQRINQSVRKTSYERFLRSPLGLFADQKIGDAVFRVMHDSASIGAVFYTGVLAPLMSIVMFVLALIVLWAQFSNERMIPIIAALSLPVVAIVASLFGRLFRTQSQQMREQGSNVMAAFEERVAQVQLVKAFGQESRETAAVDVASWQSYRSTLKLFAIVMLLVIVLAPLVLALMIFGLHHLMLEVIANRLTLGDVILIASYLSMLANPMATLGSTWVSLQAPVAGLRRIHSVLDKLSETASNGSARDLPGAIERLDLSALAIGYGATTVVHDVSMSIRAGEMVAIAGPSGCGKTTLIYSIPRFVEPSAGTIAFDGIDSRSISPEAIRRRVGFVFQQESLFSTSIADNIRYAVPGATNQQIHEAARIAGAAGFIEELPNGYGTRLGRRGARLSVGQKQRIAIARALLRRSDILILDEPTAPLDSNSESDLMTTLRGLARDRIVVLVAHRPETLGACDRVFFVHDGTVQASGPHAELLAACPAYRAYLARTEAEILA